MPYIYLILILMALGGGGYGVWSYREAIKVAQEEKGRAEEFQRAYEVLATSAGKIQQALNDSQELARKRNSRAVAAEEEAGRLKGELDGIKDKEPVVRNWASEPVPTSIRVFLGGETPFSGAKLSGSGAAAGADNGPKVSDSNK